MEVPNINCSQMNILLWNCRGALNGDFTRRVCELVVNHFQAKIVLWLSLCRIPNSYFLSNSSPFQLQLLQHIAVLPTFQIMSTYDKLCILWNMIRYDTIHDMKKSKINSWYDSRFDIYSLGIETSIILELMIEVQPLPCHFEDKCLLDQNGKKQKWLSNIQLLLKSPKAGSCTRVGVQQNVDGSTIAMYLLDQKVEFFQF